MIRASVGASFQTFESSSLSANRNRSSARGSSFAAPLRPVAVSADGIVEALELKPGALGCLPFLLSVQFHPERLANRHREHQAIFRGFTRACVISRSCKL